MGMFLANIHELTAFLLRHPKLAASPPHDSVLMPSSRFSYLLFKCCFFKCSGYSSPGAYVPSSRLTFVSVSTRACRLNHAHSTRPVLLLRRLHAL